MTTVGLFWVMKNVYAQVYQPLDGVCSLYQMWKGRTIDGSSSLKVVIISAE